MNPEMTNDPGQMLGVAIGAWLILAWVFGGGSRRVRAWRAKRAGSKRRG